MNCTQAQRELDVIYIVDDDPVVRDALSSLLRANGKTVQIFSSGDQFLEFQRNDSAACLVLDIKMPGANGLDVQTIVTSRESIPIIFLTGRADVPSTIRAMKSGAFDFLTKPVDEKVLLTAVENALEKDRNTRRHAAEQLDLLNRYRLLTPRERQVLALLVEGNLNKHVAAALGITEYTVQIHRGNIMRKMQAESFAALVGMAGRLDIPT